MIDYEWVIILIEQGWVSLQLNHFWIRKQVLVLIAFRIGNVVLFAQKIHIQNDVVKSETLQTYSNTVYQNEKGNVDKNYFVAIDLW